MLAKKGVIFLLNITCIRFDHLLAFRLAKLRKWHSARGEVCKTHTTGDSACTSPLYMSTQWDYLLCACMWLYSSTLDLLAKTFYAWIQVRNIATVEKVNNLEKAKAYHEKKLMKKVFEAWLFLRVRISYYWQVCIYIVYQQTVVTTHMLQYITKHHYCRVHAFNTTCSYWIFLFPLKIGAHMPIARSTSLLLLNAEEVSFCCYSSM